VYGKVPNRFKSPGGMGPPRLSSPLLKVCSSFCHPFVTPLGKQEEERDLEGRRVTNGKDIRGEESN